MGIEKGPLFAAGDVYVDYPFEEVMFRWDRTTGSVFRKFYGKKEWPRPIAHDNRLANDALRWGRQINRDEYLRGK